LVKLDIDVDSERPTIAILRWKVHRAGYRVVWMSETRSASRGGWHVTLKLSPPPKSAEEVVALQAILGSDLRREACNLKRARLLPVADPFWRDRWNVFYK